MPIRFFELLAGCMVAVYFYDRSLLQFNKYSNITSFLGTGLILGSSLLLSGSSTFHGINTLYPVIGTILLIIYQKGSINKFLATRFMVSVGQISYPLYLWHWPFEQGWIKTFR